MLLQNKVDRDKEYKDFQNYNTFVRVKIQNEQNRSAEHLRLSRLCAVKQTVLELR